MEITIRPYKVEDATAILEIINYNILNSTALYDYKIRTLENQIAILDEKLKKGFPVLVATENEIVVGFGFYSEFRFREAYKFTVEHSVYAHQNHIGKGIGKLLIKELISSPKSIDFCHMINFSNLKLIFYIYNL